MMTLRLLAGMALFFIVGMILPESDAFAFGQRSDICGPWNNDCNGGTSGGSAGGSTGGYSGGGYNQRQWEQQQEILRQQREAEERRHNRKEAHDAADEAIQRANEIQRKRQAGGMSQLKGTGGQFRIKSGTAVLGLKNPNPDGYLHLKGSSGSGSPRAITREWKQAHCGMWIAGFANPAAKKGDVGETRYLSGQALKTFSGGLSELDCPATPAPPTIIGRALTGKDSPFIKFQETMLAATVHQAEAINAANKALLMAKIRKSVIDKKVASNEERRNKLALAVRQAKTKGNALEEKKRLLAEADAALKKSKKEAAGVDAAIAKSTKAKKAAEAKLKVYNKLSIQVQADPSIARKLLTRVGK